MQSLLLDVVVFIGSIYVYTHDYIFLLQISNQTFIHYIL